MSDDDILEITVRSIDGQNHNLQVPRNLLISDLKCLVEEQTNVPPERQRFIFQGQPLQPHKSLSDYNVRTGHVIHLVTRSADMNNNNNNVVSTSSISSSVNSNVPGVIPQWQHFPVNIPGGGAGHVMVGQMHIAQGPDGATTTSWSTSPNSFNAHDGNVAGVGGVGGIPQATEFINSIIHSLAHSAATNAASAAATAAHQFVNAGDVHTPNSNNNFSFQISSSNTNNNISSSNIGINAGINNSYSNSNDNVIPSSIPPFTSASFESSFSSSDTSILPTTTTANVPPRTEQSFYGTASLTASNPTSHSATPAAAYTFPPGLGGGLGGIHGAQRFGPFVMGEYNGIPVAIGGAFVGGPSISSNMFVEGFPAAVQGGVAPSPPFYEGTGSNATNQNAVSVQSTGAAEVSTNLPSSTANAISASTGAESTVSTNTATTTVLTSPSLTFNHSSAEAPHRVRSSNQGFGALLSNLIQHITPAVTSMTANAVSRYIPNMDGTQQRHTATGGIGEAGSTTRQVDRRVNNSGSLDATERGRNTVSGNIHNNEREVGSATADGSINSRTTNNTAASIITREGLHEFILSISNVMETASQTIHNASLTTAQIANEVRSAVPPTSASSTLTSQSFPSTNLSAAGNPGFGTIRNTASSGGAGGGRQRLWISNDYVNERLPWDALNQLLQLLEEETGWRRPRMQLPPAQNTFNSHPAPISIFLSAYAQATNLIQTLLLQLQAWQDGYARLDVPRFGRTVQALARSSEINAQIGSLLTWIFQNMVQHVEPDSLNTAMGWSSRIVGSRVNSTNVGDDIGGRCIEERDVTGRMENESNCQFEQSIEKIETNKNTDGKEQKMLDLVDDNDDNEFKDIPMEEREGNESYQPSSSSQGETICDSTSSQNMNSLMQQQHNNNENQQAELTFDNMPEEVKRRFINWTSDSARFSQNILRDARVRPPSFAYLSGDTTTTMSARNSTQEAADRRFSLNWHRALNRLNVTNATEAPEELNEMYMAWSLRQLVEVAESNPDFQSQPNRYPGIHKALALIGELNENEEYEKPN